MTIEDEISIFNDIDISDIHILDDIDTNIQVSPTNLTSIEIGNYQSMNGILTKEQEVLEKARQEEIKGWTREKQIIVEAWQKDIEYERLVNYFYIYTLKKREGDWSWLLILISTIVSGISLLTFEDEEYPYVAVGIRIAICICSIITTLIASWLKKQNYVERIKLIDRYLTKLTQINTKIDNIISKAPWDRIEYHLFLKKYQDPIVALLGTTPPMAPDEYKATVYNITRYYPELIKDKYPWYNECGITSYGNDVLHTYKYVKYYHFTSKLFSWFFCKSKCCKSPPNSIFENYKSTPIKHANSLSIV